MSRTIKQIIYGAFYLILISLLGYGIYSLLIQPAPTCFDNRQNQGEEEPDCGGPCAPCALKHLRPLESKVQFFGVDDNTNAVVTLANPNLNYGAESFTYTLNFYNQSNQKIFSLTKESFIYPAETQKTIIEPNLKVNSRDIFGRPELFIQNPVWKPVSEFSEPKVQTRQVKTEISEKLVSITGLLANRESFSLSRAGVGALIYRDSNLVGVSKTILQNLQPLEERAFKIVVPIDLALKLKEISTVLTTEARR